MLCVSCAYWMEPYSLLNVQITNSAGAAIHYPKLFDALVLVDPVILVPKVDSKDFLKPLILGAVQRRLHWSSL